MYDVIDTFVSSQPTELIPATLLEFEGEKTLQRVLPLELPQLVEPKVAELKSYVKSFREYAERIQEDFVRCGYVLNLIKRRDLYRYVVEQGEQGYTNFYKFCEEKMRVPKTTAQRLIAINEHFCENGPKLPEAYQKYSSSKLAVMARYKNGMEGKLSPEVSVRSLQKLHDYYASHDWNVNLDTTWKEDLENFEREKQEKNARKSKYLYGHKFVSAVEEEQQKEEETTKKENEGLITDRYKMFTKFFDQTLRSLRSLEGKKDDALQGYVKELKETLQRMQMEILSMQGKDMMQGL